MKCQTLILLIITFFSLSLVNHDAFSQSLLNDLTNSNDSQQEADLFEETIKVISKSKKIFILTNENQKLNPGDFISILMDKELAVRALVAKIYRGKAGIKIMKIYSLRLWERLYPETRVQILKGDDSYYKKKAEKDDDKKKEDKIKSEQDLYDDNIILEDELGTLSKTSSRHIKPDNIVSLNGAYLNAEEVQSRGGTARAMEMSLSWSYQFYDNFFVEGLYGRALIDNFPGDGIQTLSNHLVARLKYNLKGPLYTFILPYVGFHAYNISSPDAGNTTNASVNNEEVDAVEKLKKSGVVAGITILRRLVPGWFVKTDIGSDQINLGVAIEF